MNKPEKVSAYVFEEIVEFLSEGFSITEGELEKFVDYILSEADESPYSFYKTDVVGQKHIDFDVSKVAWILFEQYDDVNSIDLVIGSR